MPFFPPASGGSSEWLNSNEFYISPSGNDNAVGDSWQAPKRTYYAGLSALIAAGGGTLFAADNCAAGGPVPFQGIWLRSDDANAGDFLPAGFLSTNVPIRIVGCGKVNGGNSFYTGVQARFDGGGSRALPSLWVVGSLSMPTIQVLNLKQKTPHTYGAEIGCDYDRKLNGDVQALTITNGTRTGDSTTYTVDLPAVGLAVTSAARVSEVTTLTIANPGIPFPPWRTGVPFHLESATGDFDSGDFVISASSNPLGNNATWTISYAEPGEPDVPSEPVTAEVFTHGCMAGELIHLTSTNVHFQSQQYLCDSVTVDTITVTDVWGDGDRNINNIGTLAHQERFYCGTSNFQAENCTMAISQNDGLAGGHSWDVGHTQAISPTFQKCWYEGYVGDGNDTRDPMAMSAILVYAGTSGQYGPAAAGIRLWDSAGINGEVYVDSTTGTGRVDVRRILTESIYPSLALPAVEVNGNRFTSVYARDVDNADSLQTTNTLVTRGIPITGVDVQRCNPFGVLGPAIGGDIWCSPSMYQVENGSIPSPWVLDHISTWADGRITGKHPAAVRGMGLLTQRFENVAEPTASWIGAGLTITSGQPDPAGGTNAYKLELSGVNFVAMRGLGADGNTWAPGCKLLVSGWVNSNTANDFIVDQLLYVQSGGQITFTKGDAFPVPANIRGWQFVQAMYVVDSVSTPTPSYYPSFYLGTNCDVDVYGWTARFIDETVNESDIYEYFGTVKHAPAYLQPGMHGTMEGEKAIIHGGMGIATGITKTVGAGSGQLTLTGTGTVYEPRYGADGTTVLGWVALLQATVNP